MIWSFLTCNVCIVPEYIHMYMLHIHVTHTCTHNSNDCSRFNVLNWNQLLTLDLVHGFFGIAAYRHPGMSLCVINFTS